MVGLFASAFSLQQALLAEKLRFCFIGGIVLQRWGEPRFTADIDLTLLCPFGDESGLVEVLQRVLISRIASPQEMANEARIYLGKLANGTPVDIALGGLLFEERAIQRATRYAFSDDISLLTCSAEDLIVMKAFANRERDWLDVESVLIRQAGRLDWQIIEEELQPLASLREEVDIVARLNALRRLHDAA
jgi:hypothetical protein